MKLLFAAVPESASGTFETCRRYLKTSVSWGRPEVTSARPERRDRPSSDIVNLVALRVA